MAPLPWTSLAAACRARPRRCSRPPAPTWSSLRAAELPLRALLSRGSTKPPVSRTHLATRLRHAQPRLRMRPCTATAGSERVEQGCRLVHSSARTRPEHQPSTTTTTTTKQGGGGGARSSSLSSTHADLVACISLMQSLAHVTVRRLAGLVITTAPQCYCNTTRVLAVYLCHLVRQPPGALHSGDASSIGPLVLWPGPVQ